MVAVTWAGRSVGRAFLGFACGTHSKTNRGKYPASLVSAKEETDVQV